MNSNKFNDIFHKTSKKMIELNKEYQQMSLKNKKQASKIKESIESKSKGFRSKRESRKKDFDFIHNK
ncbi:hypothetical protein Q4S57_14800 [Priestia megaterium]|uniref:hypothetical protein n=1 Tax=Priestia megaterium TaxID=1404 RepID=UPI0026E41603|nr:hypothetical protein [Priestia megaterium]MDO6849227.1 hypothetical protein [Priestia megaterium]